MTGAVLAIETALAQCAVCVLEGGRETVRAEPMAKGHAETLPLMVREALEAAGVAAGDLSRIAVTVGPGSFTGVRVGLAFARGLAVGTPAEAVGISTLEAIARAAGAAAEGEAVAAVVDARRGEAFLQVFDGETGEPLSAPGLFAAEAAARAALEAAEGRALRFAGPAADPVLAAAAALGAPTVRGGPDVIDPAFLARLARSLPAVPGGPRALYVRAPDATPPAPSPFAPPPVAAAP